MEVVNAQSALLSNYEVLSLLRELEADHLSRTKTAVRIKKEEEAAGVVSNIIPGEKHPSNVEIIQNLRTVEVEAIKYLSADYQVVHLQTDESVSKLVKTLSGYDLTKAEKLQIVNLAPKSLVELYAIVEELEDRLGGSMEELVAEIKSTLSSTVPVTSSTYEDVTLIETRGHAHSVWDTGDGDANDMDFDDRGEGAGVEGDLDVDDD
ncbi:HRDC-like protein [Mucidula mucida]|nr:HRDC-like protein [Mucidula mucida]